MLKLAREEIPDVVATAETMKVAVAEAKERVFCDGLSDRFLSCECVFAGFFVAPGNFKSINSRFYQLIQRWHRLGVASPEMGNNDNAACFMNFLDEVSVVADSENGWFFFGVENKKVQIPFGRITIAPLGAIEIRSSLPTSFWAHILVASHPFVVPGRHHHKIAEIVETSLTFFLIQAPIEGIADVALQIEGPIMGVVFRQRWPGIAAESRKG